VGERRALPIEVDSAAKWQLDDAHAWWEINRPAAPNAIRDDFRKMTRILATAAGIGRRATDVKNQRPKNLSTPGRISHLLPRHRISAAIADHGLVARPTRQRSADLNGHLSADERPPDTMRTS
jgi:hypothetical protein